MVYVIIAVLLILAILPFSRKNLIELRKKAVEKRAKFLGMDPIFKSDNR